MEDQLNDLTELHQHEMANLKQELASIEERVAYQAHERARDIQVYYSESTQSMCLQQPFRLDHKNVASWWIIRSLNKISAHIYFH